MRHDSPARTVTLVFADVEAVAHVLITPPGCRGAERAIADGCSRAAALGRPRVLASEDAAGYSDV